MSTDKITFLCGCEFATNEDGRPIVNPDIYALPMNCQATWDMICEGNTKGAFQLESQLGQSKAKQVKPRTIEEYADLTAIIRPGTGDAIVDGKSLTMHYIDRKSGEDAIEYFHPALEPILKETYGILCIHEDTYISMKNGTEKKIKEVNIDDDIVSIYQNGYYNVSDKCVGITKSPKTSGVILTLENGYRITLTEDHKVYTQRGPIMIKNLEDEDVIQIVVNQDNDKQQNIKFPLYDTDSRFGYLIGQLVGDGCSGQAIASGTKENHNKLYDHLCADYPELNFREYQNKKGCWYIAVSGSDLLNKNNHGNRKTKYRKFIEILGLDKTKNEKVIPEIIFKSSAYIRRSFLAGLFDSDGYAGIANNRETSIRHFCSNNPEIINGIRKLLSLEGIETYISNGYKHIYALNTKKFDEILSHYIIIKNLEGVNTEAERYGSFPRSYLRDRITSTGNTIRGFCRKNNLCRSSISKSGLCNIKTAKAVGFDFGDISFMKVKNIEPVDNQVFYSISIENTHNLIGNGIVISNCYQEQAMRIVQEIAGFTLQQADNLRKAMGKKKVELMDIAREEFMGGCKKIGIVSEVEAKEIFSWIEKSQKYSFNKSHAVAYALNGYQTAYIKAHFPVQFFAEWLTHYKSKVKPLIEINELVSNARLMDIDILLPSIEHMNEQSWVYNGRPVVGMLNIKNVGQSVCNNLKGFLKNSKIDPKTLTWEQFLMRVGRYIKSNSLEAMIKVGFFDYYGVSRNTMLYQFEIFKEMRDKHKEIIANCNADTFTEGIQCVIEFVSNARRTAWTDRHIEELKGNIVALKNPSYDLTDTPSWIAKQERELLGIEFSCTEVDEYDTLDSNCTCKEFIKGFNSKSIAIACKIDNIRKWKIRGGKHKGETMAFLKVSDSTCSLENITVFSNEWAKVKDKVQAGKVLLLRGIKDKKTGDFQVKNAQNLKKCI